MFLQVVRQVVRKAVRQVVHQVVRQVVHQVVRQLVRQVVHQVVQQVVRLVVRQVVHQVPVCIAVMLKLSSWKLYKGHQLLVKLSYYQSVVVSTGGGEVFLCNCCDYFNIDYNYEI